MDATTRIHGDEGGRREFLRVLGGIGTALAVPAAALAADRRGLPRMDSPVGQQGEEDVTPPEDLMREHGVLKRILLVYGEAIRRIDARLDLPPDAVRRSAEVIRSFIEDYHEKLEEDFVFPRFEKAGRMVDLTKVLRAQHLAGRRLTDRTLSLATPQGVKDAASSRELRGSLEQFIRMYSPHEAREDTVLFPAFRSVVSKTEFAGLGDEFENKERALFGEDGFERVVARVDAIEKTLGIEDLSQFTPKG